MLLSLHTLFCVGGIEKRSLAAIVFIVGFATAGVLVGFLLCLPLLDAVEITSSEDEVYTE